MPCTFCLLIYKWEVSDNINGKKQELTFSYSSFLVLTYLCINAGESERNEQQQATA